MSALTTTSSPMLRSPLHDYAGNLRLNMVLDVALTGRAPYCGV